jgi:hypothetical protein
LEILRAFRKERIWKQSHKAVLWGGQRINRFGPVLAPLRCAGPAEALERFAGKVAPTKAPWLKSGMKDFQLYQQISGWVEPRAAESVTLKPKEQEIEVRVGFADTLWGCPNPPSGFPADSVSTAWPSFISR